MTNAFNAFGQVVEVRSLVDVQLNVWATVTHYYDGRGLEVETVDAMGYLTSQEYDAAGNLTRRTEYAGALENWDSTGHGEPARQLEDREVSYAYDGLNRKVEETRSVLTNGARLTATTTYGYDAVGNVTCVTDAYQNSTYSFYDAMGRVRAVVAPPRDVGGVQMAPATTFWRDALGEVVEEVQLRNGAKVSTDGALELGAENGFDRKTVREYDAAGHVVRTIDASGTTRYCSYDAAGRLAKQWVTVGNYGPDGLISKHTVYSVFEYDRLGQQTAIVTPASNSVLLPNGLIRSVSQSAVGSLRTEMEYDAYGAMTKRTTSGFGASPGGVESFKYDAAGRLWWTNSGDGRGKVNLYDLLGRQTSVITSAGSAMGAGKGDALSEYSSAQEVDQLNETLLRRTDMKLDLLGRVRKLTLSAREFEEDGAPTTRVRPMVLQGFDRWGNVLVRTDPTNGGYLTEFYYNSNNQVLWEKGPEVAVRRATGVVDYDVRPVTERYYDLLGRLIWVQDANGNLNSQKWNAGGQLETETHADTGVVTHSYNVFGDQVELKDAENNVTTYYYDRMGRNVAVLFSEIQVASVDPNSMEVTTGREGVWLWKSYDEVGRLVSEKRGQSEETYYKHDARGNVVAVTKPMGQVTYAAYDANGRQTAAVDENGNTKTWEYDGFGHLLSKTDFVLDDSTPAGTVQAAVPGVVVRTELEYDNAGQLLSEKNDGGMNKSYSYDSAGQLRGVDDAALTQSTRYKYDKAGRRVSEFMLQAPSTATGGASVIQSQTLGYDALGRLAYVKGLGGLELTFEYDAVGNRMHEVGLCPIESIGSIRRELWFAYDEMNRQVLVDGGANGNKADIENLWSSQSHFLTYDLNGNRKSDVHRGVVVKSDDPGQVRDALVKENYSYDAMNRLTKVTVTGYGAEAAQWAGVKTLETLDYDAASRVVRSGPQGALSKEWVDAYTGKASNAVSESTVVNLYDANGRLRKVRTDNPDDELDSETVFEYDAAGNQLALTTTQGDVKTHTQYSYVELDGYKQKVIAGYLNDDVAKKGVTTSRYDANGYLTAIDETVRGDTRKFDQSRTFVNDTNGAILLKRQVDPDGEARFVSELVVNGNVLAVYGVGIDPNMPADDKGGPRFIGQANFDPNFEPITNSNPGQAQTLYSVRAGDTLSGIARAVYGDSSLWYLIADANGLWGDSDLHVGMTVVVPNRAGGTHNSSDVFKPYDPL